MSITQTLKDGTFFVTDDKDVMCIFEKRYVSGLMISDYPGIIQSIEITKEVVADAYLLDKKQFVDKYEERLLPKALLTTLQLYRTLRDIIVDEKVVIKAEKKIITKAPKGSRLQQVKNLIAAGIISPKEIASHLGTNAAYVSTLIRKIKNENE